MFHQAFSVDNFCEYGIITKKKLRYEQFQFL